MSEHRSFTWIAGGYYAKKENDDWIFERPMDEPINHTYFNTGNSALSVDRNKIFFTRCRTNWKKEEICELFVSIKENDKWSLPVKLDYPVNNENYTSTQPTVSLDGQRGREVIYFVSNRPGGKGGLDIWYTSYSKRQEAYREPRNAGSSINTPGDDCTPFYDNTTSTLYYSSTGLPGFGGFDIYKAMSGVIFQDVGVLVGDKFDIANVSAATGWGVRFNTILGPIRFDIAWKWRVRKKFESRYAWFLAFGNAF